MRRGRRLRGPRSRVTGGRLTVRKGSGRGTHGLEGVRHHANLERLALDACTLGASQGEDGDEEPAGHREEVDEVSG